MIPNNRNLMNLKGKINRNSSSNLKNLLQTVQNEVEMEEKIHERNMSAISEAEAISNHNLNFHIANELKDDNRQKFLDTKRRQQLRESTQELKELERKLRAAYIYKGLAAQKAEKELLLAQEREKQNEEIKLLEKAQISYEDEMKQREIKEKFEKDKLMNALKMQMEEREYFKSLRTQENLEEKKKIEEITKKVKEEQHKEQLEEFEKRQKIKQDVEDLIKAKEMIKVAQKTVSTDEDKDIEKLRNLRDEQAKKEKEEKLKIMKEKEAISEAIGLKLNLEEKEKYKRFNILEDLLIEEKAAKDDEIERRKMEIRQLIQDSHKYALHMQLEDNKRKFCSEISEQKRYREMLLKELAKLEEQDKIKEKCHKDKMMKYRKDLLDDLENKTQLRANELNILIHEREKEIRESQRTQQLIEEERIRMLKEHIYSLDGYLPPGVLKPSDKEFLSQSAAKEMQ